jgi:hypothetical protein
VKGSKRPDFRPLIRSKRAAGNIDLSRRFLLYACHRRRSKWGGECFVAARLTGAGSAVSFPVMARAVANALKTSDSGA